VHHYVITAARSLASSKPEGMIFATVLIFILFLAGKIFSLPIFKVVKEIQEVCMGETPKFQKNFAMFKSCRPFESRFGV
jgi:hypothetical protein